MTTTPIPSKESDFFRYLDIHVSEINDYPGSLQDIYFNRRFEGFIIREVFSKDVMEQVTNRLEQDKGDMSSIFVSSQSKSALIANINHSYGPGLFGSSDLEGYFAKAAIFRNGCRTLFQGNVDYEERIESVLHALSGGLPVSIPTGTEGKVYNSSSIRIIPDGHEIPIHVGKEPLLFPQASHLRTLVDITDQFSFFIPLSLPETGGELVVYDLEFDEEKSKSNQAANIYEIGLRTKNLNPDSYKSKVLAPGVGDMLLFDGGRYYHRVTQVSGQYPRRTIGGFVNFSHDHETLYYWN